MGTEQKLPGPGPRGLELPGLLFGASFLLGIGSLTQYRSATRSRSHSTLADA